MIKGHSDLLWLQIYPPCVKALKDHIDTALVFAWLILSHDSCVNDAVVNPPSIFGVKIFVTLAFESLLNVAQAIFGTGDHALIERMQSVKALVSVKHKKNARGFFDQEHAGNRGVRAIMTQ